MKIIMDPKTYTAWINMKERCSNSNNPDYFRYGGRGITYDPRWKLYTNFVEDMGNAPRGLTLNRIDNDKGYYKENCQWATWLEQAQNKGKRRSNTSGVTGVYFSAKRKIWIVQVRVAGNNQQLYRGKDFSEACRIRKEWEART